MQNQYKYGYYNPQNKSMEEKKARVYTKMIYDAAHYYELDPFLLFALGNFESYFSNILGDLNRLDRKFPDPAQGMFQILRSTAWVIYADMKDQDLPHTPGTFPSDLRKYPKAQIYFAAHYLHSLYDQHHGNPYMALLFYNARAKPNFDYPRKVMRFYESAKGHYLKSIQRPEKAASLVIEAASHTPKHDASHPILSQ
jgi:soluble lytic murein transglycosylase-like protein